MKRGYGLLGYNSSEGQWIRYYKEENPNATLREVAEVFRKQINPNGDIEVAERIVKVYLGLEPQGSVDDLVPEWPENPEAKIEPLD